MFRTTTQKSLNLARIPTTSTQQYYRLFQLPKTQPEWIDLLWGKKCIPMKPKILINEEIDKAIHLPEKEYKDLKGFSAIVGTISEQVIECIDMFKEIDGYQAMGAKLPKGLLMVGPPGTGKTSLAKAIAEESGAFFESISATSFNTKYFGESEKIIRKLFKKMHRNSTSQPSILFIDEIDAVGSRKDLTFEGSRSVLNELLYEMDGIDQYNVFVIAATNCADLLDPALKRPGRFDKIIEVPYPDYKNRIALFDFYLSFTRYNTTSVSAEFIEGIAQDLENVSPADIRYIVNEAAIIAVRNHAPAIHKNHIENATRRFNERNIYAQQTLQNTFFKSQPKVPEIDFHASPSTSFAMKRK